MKKLFLVIVILALAGAGVWYFLLRSDTSAAPGVEYRTAKVERGEIIEGVAASGTVQPVVLVQVGTQISGVIEKLFADFNSQVKAGQTIALLDSRRLATQVAADEAAVSRAKADVERMKAAVLQARADVVRTRAQAAQARADVARVQALLTQSQHDFERQKTLFDRQLIAASDLDSAVALQGSLAAQLSSAQANVDQVDAQIQSAESSVQQDEAQVNVGSAVIQQAQAQLAGDRVNLDYATIVSPVDGTVVSRNVDVGQTVAASLQAPTLFLIAQDLTKIQVQVSVPEADIGKIHKDQPAHFSVDAYTDKSFDGVVSQVRLASTTVQNVVTYTVVVDASNPDGLLFPGMTATLTFEIARSAKDALHVPVTALRVTPAPELLNEVPGAPAEGTADKTAKRASGSAGAKSRKSRHYVYVVDGNNRLRAIAVKPGISDLLSTTIEPVDANSLQEGTEIVTAILREAEAATTNPFAPRMPTGRPPR
jgi:HlyD family secretion protein